MGAVGLTTTDRTSALGRALRSFPLAVDDGFSNRRRGSSAFRLIPTEVLLVGRLSMGAEGVNFPESTLEAVETAGALGREVMGGREAGFPVSIDDRTELRN